MPLYPSAQLPCKLLNCPPRHADGFKQIRVLREVKLDLKLPLLGVILLLPKQEAFSGHGLH
jgi:hypothetical protein